MDRDTILRTPGEFRLLEYDVPDFVGDWTAADYGDPRSERIEELKQEFDLDSVVAGCDSEWEQILALKRWVRTRWDHGWSQASQEVKDALDVLRAAARGDQFNCGFYAMVFRECATALGWPTRPVGLALDHCEFPRDFTYWNIGHSVPEVWSNEFAKWVLMDPDLNVHYEFCQVPLCATEIHDEWLNDRGASVEMVQDQPEFTMPCAETVAIAAEVLNAPEFDQAGVRLKMERFGRFRAMDYYARVRIGGWMLVDDRCLPTFVSHFQPSGCRGTRDEAALNWSVNLARCSLEPSWDEQSATLQVKLEHCMPYFSHYEVRVDDADWQPIAGDALPWGMRGGVNTLEFRAVNACAVAGPTSRVVVGYAPPAWQ